MWIGMCSSFEYKHLVLSGTSFALLHTSLPCAVIASSNARCRTTDTVRVDMRRLPTRVAGMVATIDTGTRTRYSHTTRTTIRLRVRYGYEYISYSHRPSE